MLRIAAAATAALLAVTLLPGCPLAPGCGGYTGGGDRIFRTTEGASAIQCENGAFVLTAADGTTRELRQVDHGAQDGATGAFAFDWTIEAAAQPGDAAIAISQTLGGDWREAQANEVQLDYADQVCQEVATRAWWSHAATAPVATAFVKATEDPACVDCQDELLICPDGTAQLAIAKPETIEQGTYDLTGGQLAVVTSSRGVAGTYANPTGAVADGALATFGLLVDAQVHWHTVAPTAVSLRCL